MSCRVAGPIYDRRPSSPSWVFANKAVCVVATTVLLWLHGTAPFSQLLHAVSGRISSFPTRCNLVYKQKITVQRENHDPGTESRRRCRSIAINLSSPFPSRERCPIRRETRNSSS